MELLTEQGQTQKRRKSRRFVELLPYREDDPNNESTKITLLTTNVSVTWFHLRPKTCVDCSAPLHISYMAEDEVSQSSGFIAEVISSALLTN